MAVNVNDNTENNKQTQQEKEIVDATNQTIQDLIESIEGSDGKKTTKRTTLWYPLHTIGNKPDIVATNSTGKKKDQQATCDLEKYGAYHFEIYYYPSKIKGTQDTNNALIEGALTPEEVKKNMDTLVEEDFDSSNAPDAVALAKDIANLTLYMGKGLLMGTEYGITQSQEYLKTWESQIQKQNGNNRTIASPMTFYKGKENQKFDIYLPLKNYSVNRQSGIAQKEDVITDLGTIATKNIYEGLLGAGLGPLTNISPINPGEAVKTVDNYRGATMRKFLAPRVNAPSLEVYELSWDLIPRSQKEMNHIQNILKCFNYLSVPNFSKTDMFYVLPPVMFMEVLSTNQKSNEIYKIRQKRQYYVTSIGVDYSSKDGEVLLTPEGYPMFITLKLNLIKADLTSAEEAFQYPFM